MEVTGRIKLRRIMVLGSFVLLITSIPMGTSTNKSISCVTHIECNDDFCSFICVDIIKY